MNCDTTNEIANMDMSEYWNGEGGRRWVRFQNRIDASLLHFGEKLMTTSNISNGERVLDVGCGCGDTTFEIARRVGPFGLVHGIDISNIILEQTKNRTATDYNVNFDCADAQSHLFEPKVFDLVFSRFGIMFFNDPIKAFSNIRTSLSTGGRIAFICWQPVKHNQWVNLPLQVAEKYVPLPVPPDTQQPDAFSFGEIDRIRYLLSEAGFVDTLIEPFKTKFSVGETVDEAVIFLTHIGPASHAIDVPNVDGVTRSKIAVDLFETLEPYKTPQGVKLSAAAWIVTARI